METLDSILLFFIGVGVLLGWMGGFIKQLASILGLIVGFVAAKALYASLADELTPVMGDDHLTLVQIVAFILIWIAVPLGFSVVAGLLTKALEAVSLGWLNRWLGCGLGALKYMLIASVIICVLQWIDSDNKLISKTKKENSVLYYPMEKFAGIFAPLAMETYNKVINKGVENETTGRTK